MGNVNQKRKNQIIAGASIGLFALFLTGCGGNNSDESSAPPVIPPKSPKTAAAASGDTDTASTPAGGAVTPAPGGVFSNTPGGAAPKGAAGAPTVAANLPYKPRRDPTYVDWKIPPPPPNIFGEVEPLRVATYNIVTPPPINTEVREVPTRRVSGIMSGDGVFAILESGSGNPEIVKPGVETSDGYKVVSINSDSVKLQKKEGNLIRTQVVPLSDISTNPSTGGGGLAGRMGGVGGGLMGAGPTASGVSGVGTGPRAGRPNGGGGAGSGIGN